MPVLTINEGGHEFEGGEEWVCEKLWREEKDGKNIVICYKLKTKHTKR